MTAARRLSAIALTFTALVAASPFAEVVWALPGGGEEKGAETATVRNPSPDSSGAGDWRMVLKPRNFVFPDDHAAHEDFRVEWWYYTGNLCTDDGRRFGYELTFFRTGVDRSPENPSRWTVRNLYITHFAISDIRKRTFYCFQRSRRSGVGWAGASTERYHVWNEDWEARLDGDDHILSARQDGCAIQLRLSPQKQPVLHGVRGLSQKGPSRGNASHYYSLTRIRTTGSVTVGGETVQVTGSSWMDHEFSSSFLEKGQRGWDWMAIQLGDGRELMIYQIRRNDGSADPHSSGTLVDTEGRTQCLSHEQFQLVPGRRWQSPSGASYPVRWTVRLPGLQMELEIQAAFPNQEMDTSASIGTTYWEGSVTVTGRAAGTPVQGEGYLEMTGYQGRGLGGAYGSPAKPR